MTIRDHGGNLSAAIGRFGGRAEDWCDLSTGINPVPYPVPGFSARDWNALPDQPAQQALLTAARQFWTIPAEAAVIAVPGASAAIAQIPRLAEPGTVHIPGPTYNEHAAAFATAGWQVQDGAVSTDADVSTRADAPVTARVLVHPNNPTGAFRDAPPAAPLTVIDESFCDVAPGRSMIHLAVPGPKGDVLILKSFGKFWGLAGLRLGFVAGPPALIDRLAAMLGPWPVSGPALRTGTQALSDPDWARDTRDRLAADATRLDARMARLGATLAGGTPLFRLYDCEDAPALQDHLARHHIWSRTFPYSRRWLRLGLPAPADWPRVEAAT